MAATAQETSEVSVNDGSENQEKDRLEDMSLERKDSLKAKTLKKHGHLRVKEDGQTTYKRTSSNAIMAAIQLGIGYSVGRLSAKQERDILMQDFSYVEKVWFPGAGSRETPSHRFIDFKFKSYAPSAFRYFRDLFGMQPSDFLMALSNEELRELSNPGASGSLFFLSADDNFIIKTVQHKEATFLQQLLPGYYMNLHQNPRTLLPKFFGLYCYQSQNVNIRLVVMNNILPTTFKCHQIYDLKGSTFKRKASKAELAKKTPTKKDLDFRNDYNEGITMDAETYDAVMKTIRRDCRVLESFKIMDYSLLLGIHNMDQALRESENASKTSKEVQEEENPERVARRAEFGAALEAIQIDKVEGRPLGGIPAKSPKGDRLILFLGIIDILQSYRLVKKLEHGWKALVHDADSVSVHNPSFYAKRFIDFMGHKCFRRGPPGSTRGSAKRRSVTRPMPGGGSASATSGRQRANQSGSFSSNTTESTTPKAKEGKTKSVSVKFSEPVIIDDEPGDQMIPPPYQSQKSTDSNEATFKEEESTSETVPSDTVTARSGIEEKTEEQRPIENTEIKVEIVDAATNEVKEDTGNTTAEPKGSHIDESATSISTNEALHSPATDNHPETATLTSNDIGHQLVLEESSDDITQNDVSITSDNSVFVIGVKEPSVVSNSVTIVTKTSTATYKTVETVREGDANVIVSQTTREITEVDGGDQKAKVTEITEVIKGHSSTDVLEDSHNDDNTVKELNNIPNHVINKVQSQASGQRLVAAHVASQKSADIQVTDIDVDMKGTVDLPDVVLEGTPDIDKNDNLPNSDVMVTVL